MVFLIIYSIFITIVVLILLSVYTPKSKNKEDNLQWKYVEGYAFEQFNPYGNNYEAVAIIEESVEYIPKYRIMVKGVSVSDFEKHNGKLYVKLKDKIKILEQESQNESLYR